MQFKITMCYISLIPSGVSPWTVTFVHSRVSASKTHKSFWYRGGCIESRPPNTAIREELRATVEWPWRDEGQGAPGESEELKRGRKPHSKIDSHLRKLA